MDWFVSGWDQLRPSHQRRNLQWMYSRIFKGRPELFAFNSPSIFPCLSNQIYQILLKRKFELIVSEITWNSILVIFWHVGWPCLLLLSFLTNKIYPFLDENHRAKRPDVDHYFPTVFCRPEIAVSRYPHSWTNLFPRFIGLIMLNPDFVFCQY